MKKWVYGTLRILIGLMFILNVVGFFLVTDDSQQSRLIFNALQALGFLIVSMLPNYIERKAKVEISNFLAIMFIVLTLSHFILGEIAEFYIHVQGWDSVLHAISGAMLAVLALAIVQFMSQNNPKLKISPIFIALFAIMFAMTMGVLWEIFEFFVDGMIGSNMQRYQDSVTGEPFVGREALQDTMKDLILDLIGASVVAIIGYFDMKQKQMKRWEMFTKRHQVSD